MVLYALLGFELSLHVKKPGIGEGIVELAETERKHKKKTFT
jgi:hypothetical protein